MAVSRDARTGGVQRPPIGQCEVRQCQSVKPAQWTGQVCSRQRCAVLGQVSPVGDHVPSLLDHRRLVRGKQTHGGDLLRLEPSGSLYGTIHLREQVARRGDPQNRLIAIQKEDRVHRDMDQLRAARVEPGALAGLVQCGAQPLLSEGSVLRDKGHPPIVTLSLPGSATQPEGGRTQLEPVNAVDRVPRGGHITVEGRKLTAYAL